MADHNVTGNENKLNEEAKDCSRRDFFKIGAAGAVVLGGAMLGLTGCETSNAVAKPEEDQNQDNTNQGGEGQASGNGNQTTPNNGTEQNPTNEQNQPEGENANTAGLPEDWESWGVPEEIAQARWNYILAQAKKLEDQGYVNIQYGIPKDPPNSYWIAFLKEETDRTGGGGTHTFPTNHKPPLY